MPLTREEKSVILDELSDKFSKAKSVFFAEYKGLPVKGMRELRKRLREKRVDFKVSKRTLFKLAAKKSGVKEIPDEVFLGTVGAAFSYDDEIAAAKILHMFSKEAEQLKLLGGIMEGRILTLAEVRQLAILPGREELIAKFVFTLKWPISGFHAVLHNVLRNFVGILAAYQEKKGKEAPEASATASSSLAEMSATSEPAAAPSAEAEASATSAS